MITMTIYFPHCESGALVCNGRASNEKQKYLGCARH